jgi:hypothetical protein
MSEYELVTHLGIIVIISVALGCIIGAITYYCLLKEGDSNNKE